MIAPVNRSLLLSLLLLVGCPGNEGQTQPLPAKTETKSTPAAKTPAKTQADPPTKTPEAKTVSSQGGKAPRKLADILLELEEIEGTGIDFDDPEKDYERRYERPEQLVEEAVRLGPTKVDLLLKRLVEAQALPREVGYLRRRSFLCRVIGRLAPKSAQAVAAAFPKLPLKDVRRIVKALPETEAGPTTAGWFKARSGFAKNTGGGASEVGLRVVLLEGYALTQGGKLPATDGVLVVAREDPSGKVRKRAADLTRP